MTGKQFLSLPKDKKQRLTRSSTTQKEEKEDGTRAYFIEATACCGSFQKWEWGKAPELCPKCKMPHWTKPTMEYYLFEAQDRFLKKYPDTRILGEEMFPIIVDYAKNHIQGLLKGNTVMREDALDEKANDAATMLVEVILKDNEHRMRYSFGEYLKRLCKSVVFGGKRNDWVFSLNEMIDGQEKELGDKISVDASSGGGVHKTEKIEMSNIAKQQTEKTDTVGTVMDLVDKSVKAIVSNTSKKEVPLLYVIGLVHKFKSREERSVNGYFEVVDSATKKFVEKGELLVFQYLRTLAG